MLSPMSLFSILSTIEDDINKGLQIAAPIIGTFAPGLGPILTEIGSIVATIETALAIVTGGRIAPAAVALAATAPQPPTINLSSLVQNIAFASAVAQYKAHTATA